jgi:hypothetical protein
MTFTRGLLNGDPPTMDTTAEISGYTASTPRSHPRSVSPETAQTSCAALSTQLSLTLPYKQPLSAITSKHTFTYSAYLAVSFPNFGAIAFPGASNCARPVPAFAGTIERGWAVWLPSDATNRMIRRAAKVSRTGTKRRGEGAARSGGDWRKRARMVVVGSGSRRWGMGD